MLNSLLLTKLFYPQSKANTVHRDALIHRFLQGLNRPLTIVSTPAGFGKTTFVASALRHQNLPVLWVSLDSDDQDFFAFWKLILTSLQQQLTEFGKRTQALLENNTPPSADQLMISLLNELIHVQSPYILVLDDYHATDSSDIDDSLRFLLEHQPPTLKLVIITREDPNLSLGSLRAKACLSEFRAQDLRFDPQEAKRLFNNGLSLNLSDEQASALTERTEGWVVGMQLAAISMQNLSDCQDFIEQFSGSHRFVVDYLVEEVIQQLPREQKSFILQVVTLPKFCAELCNRVLQITNSQDIIGNLEKQNLFVTPLDNEKRWYRFHHLFADTLKAYAQTSEAEKALFYQQAGEWFYEQELFLEAIQHASMANSVHKMLTYLEKSWPILRHQIPETQLIQWSKQIPDAVLINSNTITTHYATALLSSDLPAGIKWLQIAEQSLQEQNKKNEHANLQGLIFIGKAYAAGANGEIQQLLDFSQKALDCLDESELVWRASARILQGITYWQMGQLSKAEEAIVAGHRLMRKSGEISSITSSGYLLANLFISRGKRAQGEKICLKIIEAARAFEFIPQGLADIYVTLAILAIDRYDLTEAKALLQKADDLGEAGKLLETAHHWYVAMAWLAMQEGQFADAQDLLEEARMIKSPSPAPELAPIEAWEARNAIKSGDFSQASAWVQTIQVQFDGITLFEKLTLVYWQIAHYLASQDSKFLKQTDEVLRPLLQDEIMIEGSEAEVHLLSCLTSLYQKQERMANEHFYKALKSVEPDRYAFYFIEVLKDFHHWMEKRLTNTTEYGWLQSLLSKQNKQPDSQATHSLTASTLTETLIEPLSDREIEVLQHLKSELSGPEIANTLFVSLNTLRTHTKNIYSKLAVNNRRAAIRKAQELNL